MKRLEKIFGYSSSELTAQSLNILMAEATRSRQEAVSVRDDREKIS